MGKEDQLISKLAILSISLLLMSSPAINGSLSMIQNYFGLSLFKTEILSTLPSLFALVTILFSSYISEFIGMKWTVIIDLLLVGIGGGLPVVYFDFNIIMFSRIILGIGLGLFNSLAVTYITLLYHGKNRARLLGLRNSFECLGQSILTILSGYFAHINIRYIFSIYFIVAPILLLFFKFVPSNKNVVKSTTVYSKPNHFDISIILFAIFFMINSSSLLVRFPSMAVKILNESPWISTFLALTPIFGIFSGGVFGIVYEKLKHKIIILDLFMLVLINLIFSQMSTHIEILVLGLVLLGVLISWTIPYIFMIAELKTNLSSQFRNSLIVAAFNLGVLAAPFCMKFIHLLFRTKSYSVPFSVYGILTLLILLFISSLNYQNKFN